MLNQGQFYSTKKAAQAKAQTLRRKGASGVYIRKYRYGKGSKNKGKGDLGWMVNW